MRSSKTIVFIPITLSDAMLIRKPGNSISTGAPLINDSIEIKSSGFVKKDQIEWTTPKKVTITLTPQTAERLPGILKIVFWDENQRPTVKLVKEKELARVA